MSAVSMIFITFFFYHWVHDDIVFCDEQQRHYVFTNILMASYFDCRPVFMFDTRSRFAGNLFDYITAASRSENCDEDSKAQGTENSIDWNDNRVMLVNSKEELAFHVDRSTYWNNDNDSDIDDDVDADFDEIGFLFWKHIIFIIASNRVFEKFNILFVKMTIIHTKRENNRFREWVLFSFLCIFDFVFDLLSNKKTFIIERKNNFLFCFLDHFLFMIFYDDVFVAKSLKNVNNIFRVKISVEKKCLQLKMKRTILNISIFRELERVEDEHRTSSIKSLKLSTWLRYFRRLSRNSELEQFFIQYCARRDLINVVNSKSILLSLRFFSSWASMLIRDILADQASSFVRDQIFDHQSNAVRYYLDRQIRFNTQIVFLNRLFDDVVQKLIKLMTLTVDLNALIKLSEKLSKKLINSKRMIELSHKNKIFTNKLKHKYRFLRLTFSNDSWLQAKKQMNIALHRKKVNRRNRMLNKIKKRHFRNANTAILETQFIDASFAAFDKKIRPSTSSQYDISERDEIVRLTCELIVDFIDHEKHVRRIEIFRTRMTLCVRQKSRRRQSKSIQFSWKQMIFFKTFLKNSKKNKHDRFFLICKFTQCIFCLDNERKFYQKRTAEYAKLKMMNEVERHLKKFASSDSVSCPHPRCTVSGSVFLHVTTFKNHTATIHKILLRA